MPVPHQNIFVAVFCRTANHIVIYLMNNIKIYCELLWFDLIITTLFSEDEALSLVHCSMGKVFGVKLKKDVLQNGVVINIKISPLYLLERKKDTQGQIKWIVWEFYHCEFFSN